MLIRFGFKNADNSAYCFVVIGINDVTDYFLLARFIDMGVE